MEMSGYLLGVDIGTGSTKAIAVDQHGTVLFATHVAYPTLQPLPGHSEQAPELIWQAFIKCIRTTTARLGDPLAISLSSAMHSVLPVDNEGRPLCNLILWSDNRSASIAERIKNSASGEMLYEQCGTPLHAMTPLCKILWLKENAPEIFARASKFISIKEYIWFQMFGTYEIDHSIASATGMFDIEALTWNTNALLLIDIHKDQLSVPVPTSFLRKLNDQSATQLNVSADTTIVIGSSDGCLANLGTQATRSGIAALTIGTSGAIRVTRDKPVFNFESMPFNYRLDEETFISGGPVNNGGVALKWYAENFLGTKLDTVEDYQKLLGVIPSIDAGSNDLIFLPYVLGERAPIWNSEACGVFFGMTAQHHRAHFTRAVIEGISLALYHVSRALEKNEPIKQINVSGGFVRSTEWLQILADIFGKEICLVHSDDASAIGATYLAMKALGMIKSYDEIKMSVSSSFHPDMARHRHYASYVFPKYERLYTLLKDEMNIPAGKKTSNLTTP
jgi:gluconokinase